MNTQQDHKIRVLALANLRAICERASGMCHRFTIDKITRSRVHVAYSNPDEYGSPNPITAVFPCYPSVWGAEDADNPRIIMDPIRVYGGREEHERDAAYQSIDAVIVCAPTLWRSHGTIAGVQWKTHSETAQQDNGRTTRPNTTSTEPRCTICAVCDMKA